LDLGNRKVTPTITKERRKELMDIGKYMKQLEAHSLALYESKSKKEEEKRKLNPHQEKVKKAIDDRFGCRNELVRKFASAFMNCDFDYK